MRRIIRHLFVLVLVVATTQSGMAQWTPHLGADMTRDIDISSLHSSSPRQESCAHSDLPKANAETPPEDAYGGRCDQPNIGCDCPGCFGYFDPHSLALLVIAATPPQVPESNAYESGMITLFVDLNFAPPTPPPRS